MAAITLDRLAKHWVGGDAGVRDVSLAIGDGEFVVLVGPSGSGKSTTLRLVAGLDAPTGGQILIDGTDVTGWPAQRRDLAMVFQHYALYPHKSVRENIAFPLRMHGVPRAAIEARVTEAATTLRIADLLERRPAQLSGGQRQRVALGRALVRRPRAFLLDEPLSNLDAALRLDLRAEIARLHHRLGATFLYVTHDQEEAMKLGDRIVVMRDGRIEQVGPPLEVYERPATLFVAGFIGAPPMNIFEQPVGRLPVRAGHVLGVRPHDVLLTGPDAPEAEVVADIEVVEPIGREQHVHLHVRPAGPVVIATTGADVPLRVGDTVGLRVRPDRLRWFEARSSRLAD
ncbi:MAG: ABC transporter ATP-binding protein [Vicinamibacterales bacterium]